MALQFESPDGSAERTLARLDYTGFKYEDPERLEDAAERLRQQPGCLPAGVTAPVFMPLSAEPSKIKFTLELPRADASRGASQQREAIVGTQVGLKDSLLKMPLEDFQSIWEAMADTTGAAVLFQGQVEVDLGEVKEQIPFIARLSDMAGDLFDHTEEPDVASGGVSARLRNAIESPVKINRLNAKLRRAGAEVAAQIQGLTTPTELPPGQELTFKLVAPSALPGSGPYDTAFDLDEVEVLPDLEKVWSLINLSQRPEYARKIQVKASQAMFDEPMGQPQDRITDIDLQFERGDTVTLTAEKREVEATARSPLSDFFTHKEVTGEYRYRVTVVRKSGTSTGEWQTDTTGILRIDTNKVPPAR
jgi:hypothetical protein